MTLEEKLRNSAKAHLLDLPLPGWGCTAARHSRLAEIAREDLALARLAEAHAQALAILADAGRSPESGVCYGVWASEVPDRMVRLERRHGSLCLSGSKMFCSGVGMVDRALVTVRVPEVLLIDLDLRKNADCISYAKGDWITGPLAETQTAAVLFRGAAVHEKDTLGPPGWYLNRPGFWHEACGAPSCWAGGAIGLVHRALRRRPGNQDALAHLKAMEAGTWAMRACLESAGREIDAQPAGHRSAIVRALALRCVIEQLCTDIVQRFVRAFGPRPRLDEADRRYQEIVLYIRQSNAERDLERLAREQGSRGAHSARFPALAHPHVA
jgi:alkylation response protein AidB-like acyl-CoA dehydrogenase